MGSRVAPILRVGDLDVALAYYEQLGFGARKWDGGGYAILTFDGAEIHLGVTSKPIHRATAYLFVEDADAELRPG